MKNDVANTTITSTVDTSNRRRVGLDPEGVAILMAILSNQYTDKHAAVLREYFVNGWDSHIVSGMTDTPVLVTLPTALQPTLVIQDQGRGLAEDEMIDIFGTYTKSTKRGEDETTGNFGIGSKSAWTMGQQFIVTGVRNGKKTVANFSLDEEGIGVCDIIRTLDTDEHNGVVVSLSVPDVDAMNEAATRFFATVDRGTALVNGEEPTPLFESATRVNDEVYVMPDHEGTISLVMGQVNYAVDRVVMQAVAKRLTKDAETNEDAAAAVKTAERLAAWSSDTSVFFRVPIGSVTVHPSRERLRDTNKTVTEIARLVTVMVKDLATSIQSQIDAAPSLFAANQIVLKGLEAMGDLAVSRKAFKFAGMPIKNTAKVDLPVYWTTPKSWRHSTLIVANDQAGRTVESDQVDRTLIVTEVPKGEEGKVSRYLKRFLETDQAEWVFVTDQPWGAFDWFAFGTESGARTMTLTEYKAALRANRVSNPRVVNEPSYATGWGTASKDLEDRDLLSDILSEGKDIVLYHEIAYGSALERAALEDYTVLVLLPQQSENALLKRVAADDSGVKVLGSTERKAIFQAYAAEQAKSVTDDEKAALGAIKWLADNSDAVHAWANLLSNVGLSKRVLEVTSPEFWEAAETIALVQMVTKDISDERKSMLAGLAEHLEKKIKASKVDLDLAHPKKFYPLIHLLSDNLGYYGARNMSKDQKDAVLAEINRKR
jgi:hypothetical protein